MKKTGTSILFMLLFLFTAQSFASPVRIKKNLNREWKFRLGDYAGAEDISFNDEGWDRIGLPHSFSIPYFLSEYFYVGYGWYRKEIDIPESYQNKKVSLEFEGAFQEVELYVNGELAGTHQGGYTGFNIDITPHIQVGKNIVAVRVNNLWNPQLAPRAGEHVFSGGIYRDVYLSVKNPIHISWYGTSVTTPSVSAKQAQVLVETELLNQSDSKQKVELVTTLYDSSNTEVAEQRIHTAMGVGETKRIKQDFKKIAHPQLWSVDHPNLYKAIHRVYKAGKLIDEYETSFGIRSFEWTADKGFFLNGEHVYLRGVNVHQDHAGWGDAVTNAGIRRDLKLIKEAGFNFVRGSHYPHDPYFSQVCDELGLLFWAEGVIWGTGGFSTEDGYWNASAYPIDEKDREGFHASAKQQLSELIRIHRNHPSIIAWSMSNEPFFTAEGTLEPMKKLLKECVSLSRELDSTRPAAIGGSQRPIGEDRIDKLGDIAGYNGDGGVIAEFQNPGVPNMVSEYGSTTAIRPGNYEPGWGELVKNGTHKGVEWRSGHAVWCAFDHGSIAGSMLGKMGIVDYFRIPKRAWYWYRNEYAQIAPPKWAETGEAYSIRLSADKLADIATDGTDDTQLHVEILNEKGEAISNSPTITLTRISGPGEFPTGSQITFSENSDITILDGRAAIEFRSYYAGETIIEATSPGLKSAQLKLVFVGDALYEEDKYIDSKERPYIRYTQEDQQKVIYSFGQNNPAFASSSVPQHNEGMATDGNLETYWQPLSSDNQPFLVLDSERNLNLRRLKFSFGSKEIYQLKVEVSDDKINWVTALDLSKNKDKIEGLDVNLSQRMTGRFIRILFLNSDESIPKISEAEVFGQVIN